MSREQTYTSIILRKQPYGEGDELVTVFTKEAGKLRALAKSVKFSKSKLQYGLQVLFLTKLTLTRSKLPKIIGTEPVQTFSHIRDNLENSKIAFYIIELVLKFTADEHKNEQLFELLRGMLEMLNADLTSEVLDLALAKFKLGILQASGLDVHYPSGNHTQIYFSNYKGGFTLDSAADSRIAKPETYEAFLRLKDIDFGALISQPRPNLGDLQELLSSFIEYQLERKVKSEKYLRDY